MSRRACGGRRALWLASLLTSTMFAGVAAAAEADASGGTAIGELIVTAQKREENVQNVPLNIVALSTRKLEELHVTSFNDYVKYLPSVSYQAAAPGFANVYMRGVASGENNNHSGPLPSVGIYLDEQPITTIGGALDIHVYDIARVEALSGPQGTLYGASSQAGTIRIITNKPDTAAFKAGYNLEVNHVDHGDTGYMAEGFVNIPLSDRAAIRLVAWGEHDAGYIDNIVGTRTYPTSGITISNLDTQGVRQAKDNYNDQDLYGARAALKIDLNDNWTITPAVMAQDQKTHGIFAYDPSVGDLQVIHFYPESSHDRWVQAALTVEGKISQFDLVYAGAYMNRRETVQSDYSDYSFFYDTAYGSYIVNDNNQLINPSQYIQGRDRFTKESHELRLSSPADQPFRFVAGLFYQRQVHDIEQRYKIDNLASFLEVPGWPDTLWLTEQVRVDRDYAAFGEASYDITPTLTATGGIRFFKARNSLRGFFGFGTGYSSSTGVAACFAPASTPGAPCTNLDKSVEESGVTYKANLTWHFSDAGLVYATVSRGFRPGGINRRGTLPPYKADFLTNYEFGWKTTLADGHLIFNGALFWEEWKDFQFSFLGANGLTEIKNAGQARIRGVELQGQWRPVDGLTLTGAATYTDAELTENYCGTTDAQGNPITNCASPQAPKGTALPITPKFKANATARYEWDLWDSRAHVQGALVYQSGSWADLRLFERALLGRQRSYATVDLAAGVDHGNWSLELTLENAFDKRADLYRYAECAVSVCGLEPYIVPNRPRTVALRWGQRF